MALLWIAFTAWVITQTAIPAIKHQPRLDNGIDLLVSGAACCAFIVWYLERSQRQTERDAEAVRAERAHLIEEIADIVYPVAFGNGADEERRSHQADDEIGNVVRLDEHRGDAGHTAPRLTGDTGR